MPQTFDCPKCGAPVTYERSSELGGANSTIRCEYCHSQLIAPNELAGQPARVVRIQLSSGGKFPKWILLLLVIPLFVLIVIGLAGVGILAPLFYSVSRPAREPVQPARPTLPAKESTNSFANVLLDFGSEGIGPGMFTDARSIAVDGAGRIYVGEYTGGRAEMSMRVAVDGAGNIYGPLINEFAGRIEDLNRLLLFLRNTMRDQSRQ